MQSIRDQLVGYAATKRDELVNLSDTTDDDLPPEERPNRGFISTGCLLKFGDEVECYGQTVLVLCPGRGYGYFYGLTIEGATVPLVCYPATDVTDRIPADPEEDPLPIFEETSP